MRLMLELLECRFTPAALWRPDLQVNNWTPFPDWTGPVYHLLADVTGPEANGVKVLDDVFFAGQGAGARVKVLDGGRHVSEAQPNPYRPGETWFVLKDKGKVLFDGMAFGDDTARFGLVGAATSVPGGRDNLWFAWGESNGTDDGLRPGPVLSRLTFDGDTFTRRESFVLEESYRGAVQILGMSLRPDVDGESMPDLLVLPQAGIGGPRLQVLDGTTGDVKRSWFFAAPDSREPFAVAPGLVGSWVGQFASPQRDDRGLGIDFGGDDPRSELWTWDGELIVTVRDGDPGTEWRS